MFSLKIEIDFSADGDKTRLTVAEVLLRAATGNLVRSEKQRDWTLRNAVLLLPFLTEAPILRGKLIAGELLNVFARSIMDWAKEEDTTSEADEANDDDIVVTIKAKDVKENPGKTKQAAADTAATKTAAAKTLTTIADSCDDALAFLQAVAVKSPQVIVAPLSLCSDKRTCI